MQFVSESESDDDELLPPVKIPKVETSDDGDSEYEEEAAEFAPTGLGDEEEQSGADDWVIGLVYSRTLARVLESHPLFGSHYLGQAVRSVARCGTDPQKVAEKRWSEEDSEALRVPKRLGLPAVIREHGAGALDNTVIDFQIGHRRDVQPWADEQEKGMIAAYGGPLRDMHTRLDQTLNLTDGGKGNVECKGQIALNNLAWRDFVLALTEFVNEHGTAYVPSGTVLPSGYKLGEHVCSVRKGNTWKGWPDAEKRQEWLDSLPGWTWNATQSDERKAALSRAAKQQFATQEARDAASERTKQQFANETDEQRAERIRRITESHRRPEVRAAASEKTKQQFANETDEQRDYRIRRKNEGQRRPEVRAAASEKTKQQFANETDEQRDNRIRNQIQAQNRPEVRAVKSVKTQQQFSTSESRDKHSKLMNEYYANDETDEHRDNRIQNQIQAQNRPEVRAVKSETTKQWFRNLTAEERAEWERKRKQGQNRPEVLAAASVKTQQQFASQAARDAHSKITIQQFSTSESRDKHSKLMKQYYANDETDEQRDNRIRNQIRAQNRAEVRAVKSETTKQWFRNLTAEKRAEWVRKTKEGHNRPEVLAAASAKKRQYFSSQVVRDGIAETLRNAALAKQQQELAMLPKAERDKKRARIESNAKYHVQRKKRLDEFRRIPGNEHANLKDLPKVIDTRERRETISQNTQRIARARQEAELAALPEAERAKKRAKIETYRNEHARRKRRLDALRLVPGYEKATVADLAKATAAGIAPQVCYCGVVCVCISSAGSSSGGA